MLILQYNISILPPGLTSCDLDHTPVNSHVYTFIGLSWTFSFGIPLLIIMYSYARIFLRGQQAPVVSRVTLYESVTCRDATQAKFLALLSFLALPCVLPHYAANLIAGYKGSISHVAYCACVVLLNLTWLTLPVVYCCLDRSCWRDLPGRSKDGLRCCWCCRRVVKARTNGFGRSCRPEAVPEEEASTRLLLEGFPNMANMSTCSHRLQADRDRHRVIEVESEM